MSNKNQPFKEQQLIYVVMMHYEDAFSHPFLRAFENEEDAKLCEEILALANLDRVTTIWTEAVCIKNSLPF